MRTGLEAPSGLEIPERGRGAALPIPQEMLEGPRAQPVPTWPPFSPGGPSLPGCPCQEREGWRESVASGKAGLAMPQLPCSCLRNGGSEPRSLPFPPHPSPQRLGHPQSFSPNLGCFICKRASKATDGLQAPVHQCRLEPQPSRPQVQWEGTVTQGCSFKATQPNRIGGQTRTVKWDQTSRVPTHPRSSKPPPQVTQKLSAGENIHPTPQMQS